MPIQSYMNRNHVCDTEDIAIVSSLHGRNQSTILLTPFILGERHPELKKQMFQSWFLLQNNHRQQH